MIKKISLLVLLFISLFSVAVFAEEIVTDNSTGISISLKNAGKYTIITNLETMEQIVERGNLEKKVTSETYTTMMDKKRLKDNAEVESTDRLSGSQNVYFSVTYSHSDEWESPNFYMNGTQVTSTIDYHYSTARKDASLTLMKVVSWWLDEDMGKKTFYGDNITHSWTSLTTGEYYYFEVRLVSPDNTTPTNGYINTNWQ